MPKMKAAVFAEPGRIVLEAKPIPDVDISPVSTGPNSLHMETLTTARVAVSILTL